MAFGNLLTAMVTPLDEDLKVNYNKAQELAEYLLNNGSQGLVVAGTTGESPTLSKEEKLKLFCAVKEVAKGKGAVIAGTSSYDTANSVELTKKAEACGVDGILAVAPYYNKPPQEGQYQHFAAIAAATSLPVIIYNIPGRTGINLAADTLVRLAAIENIVALKESSGSVDQVALFQSSVPAGFHIYSGDDYMTLPMLALGAKGIISVASHLVGNEIRQMLDAFLSGNNQEAIRLHYKLLPFFKNLFITTSPIPLKYCLNKIGMEVGPCRLPLVPPGEKESTVLDAMLHDHGMI